MDIFLVASCYGNRDKLRSDGPVDSYVDFTLTILDDVKQTGRSANKSNWMHVGIFVGYVLCVMSAS